MKTADRPGKLHTLCTVLGWCLSVLCLLSAWGSLETPAASVMFLLAAAAANPLVHRRLSEAKPWMFVLAFLVCVMAAGSLNAKTEPLGTEDAASSSLSGEWSSEAGADAESGEASGSDVAAEGEDAGESGDSGEDILVYITASGEKYHLSTCRYVKDGGIEISLAEAQAQGYEPCKVCCPPE
ncbi:MAG: hypothetical protein LUF84_02500 [Clostridiales bacterium]|nr:hypothetical protein [Clostridiales bacterium]